MTEELILSKKGFNSVGKPLNEDTLNSSQPVLWRNTEYTTGNRRHNQVDLWRNGEFVRTVNCKYVRLIFR